MPSLMDNVLGVISKSKLEGISNEASFDVMTSTGFIGLDYLNGTVVHVQSEKRNFSYVSAGIVDGSTNAIIGRSGSGKSTLMNQIFGNMMREYIDMGYEVDLFMDDMEGSLPQVRKEFLLQLPKEYIENHVQIRNSGVTSENMFARILAIHDEKVKNKKQYIYDTGLYDTYGERIFKLIPTYYGVDSLPMLMPQKITEDDELGGGMDASSIAKSNTMMFKKIAQLCKEANIILININHILDEINMGFAKKAAQISGLKEGERLPGGKAVLYLANNIFRVDDSLTLKPDKEYGIDGSVVEVTLIKSRTNISKRKIPLIFNKTEGKFDTILSLHYLLDKSGMISGAGAYSYFKALPDIKFNKKNFKERLEEYPELQEVFVHECYDLLYTYLSDTKIQDRDDNSLSSKVGNLFKKFTQKQIEE